MKRIIIFPFFLTILNIKKKKNFKRHPNCITGSKVTAILLNGWILPIGGASSGRVCAQPAKQACFHKFIFCSCLSLSWVGSLQSRIELLENFF